MAEWVIVLGFIIAVKALGFSKYYLLQQGNASGVLLGASSVQHVSNQIRCLNHPSGKCKEKPSNKRGRHLCWVPAGCVDGGSWAEGICVGRECLCPGEVKVELCLVLQRAARVAARSVQHREGQNPRIIEAGKAT